MKSPFLVRFASSCDSVPAQFPEDRIDRTLLVSGDINASVETKHTAVGGETTDDD